MEFEKHCLKPWRFENGWSKSPTLFDYPIITTRNLAKRSQLVTTIFSQAEIFRVTLSSDYNIHFMIINLFNVFLGVYFFCNKCAHAPLLSKKAGPIKLIRFVKYTQLLAF